MIPSPAELAERFEKLDHEPARPRYTPKKLTQNYKRIRRGKYVDWRVEMIYVPHNVWKHFAGENQKGYFGGHGSRRLYIVFYQEEEMGKFVTKSLATQFIQNKEST